MKVKYISSSTFGHIKRIYLLILVATLSTTGYVIPCFSESSSINETTIFEHISRIVAQGVRRPGYPANIWTEDYIFEQIKKFGLQEVRKEKVTHHGKKYGEVPEENLKWTPLKTSLKVYNQNRSITIAAFSVPYAASTGDVGLDLEIVELKSKTIDRNVKGKIVLYPVRFRNSINHRFFERRSEWKYDPQGTFSDHRQPPTFDMEGNEVMKYAVNSGAAGFIGVITNPPERGMYQYYMPADGTVNPIPGIYISEEDAAKIQILMKQGIPKAQLVSNVEFSPLVSHNIIGILKGNSDDWIIIGSHHDAPFAGAVEDGTGIALLLTQAEYWGRVPRNERPYNMMFIADSGHICGVTGNWSFCRKYQSFLKKVILEIHLEHIALEYGNRNGRYQPTGYRQAMWWYVSESKRLLTLVKSVIISENLERSYIFLPDAMNMRTGLPTSDGAFFHRYHVPIVQLVSAPSYLLTAADTLDKVDRKALVPITNAIISIIKGLGGISAQNMRDEIAKYSSLYEDGKGKERETGKRQGQIRKRIRKRIRERF